MHVGGHECACFVFVDSMQYKVHCIVYLQNVEGLPHVSPAQLHHRLEAGFGEIHTAMPRRRPASVTSF